MNSWNLGKEASTADDVAFVEMILTELAPYTHLDFDRVFAVNCKGVMFVLQAFVKRAMKNANDPATGGRGAIVNLASIASMIGLVDRFVYSASKGAVLTMTYSVATDYVKEGIRCNAVAPARIHTSAAFAVACRGGAHSRTAVTVRRCIFR